jgi:signal transduction histidine kinase
VARAVGSRRPATAGSANWFAPPQGGPGINSETDPRAVEWSYGAGVMALLRPRALTRSRLVLDAGIALLVTVVAQAQLDGDTAVWVRVAMLVVTLATMLRRWRPLVAALVVAAGVGVMGLQPNAPSVFGEYLAVLLVAFTVAEQLPLLAASAGGVLLAAGVVAHDLRSDQYGSPAGIVSDLAIPLVVWGLGRVVWLQRSRADALERDRLELARQAVAEERAHLARELHDVVTHSVSVVVIQAQGAQRVLGEGSPEVTAALRTIEAAGRSALTDMRRLLGLLRADDATPGHGPQPSLSQLPALVEQVRSAGLPIELTIQGSLDDLDSGLLLSAYRIVQEALTNSLKHAGPARAHVAIRRDRKELEILVEDDGTAGFVGPAGTSGGRGLVGMRERVGVFGGTLEAGRARTGFRVRAVFPLGDPA